MTYRHISPEGVHENVRATVPLIGDAELIVTQLLRHVASAPTFKKADPLWISEIRYLLVATFYILSFVKK